MRWIHRWAPALLGVALVATPAWALPQPKLPPEATDKPSVVVRVRPIGELLKDAAYVAKMVGQEDVYNAVEPGLQPFLGPFDMTKPAGFYARVGPEGIDSQGVLMLPVKDQKDFLGVLAQLGQNPTEDADGLFTLNVVGAPFPVHFRFANGYVYGTAKTTPDGEKILDKNKLFTPAALFAQGDESLVSVTLNVDAIPNALKKKALDHLEDAVRHVKEVELRREANELVRHVAGTIVEELAIKAQSFVVDAMTVRLAIDFDRAKEQMGSSFRMTARSGSGLASDFASIGTGQGIGAAVPMPPSAMRASAAVTAPGSIRKTLEPLVDEFAKKAIGSAKESDREYVKLLVDALTPTFKAGLLDLGVDFRGPNANGALTFAFAVRIQEGDRVEKALREIAGAAGLRRDPNLKIDVDKVGNVAIHRAQGPTDPGAEKLFGREHKLYFAVRGDAALVTLGPDADALAAIKQLVGVGAKASKVLEGEVSMRNVGTMMDREEPGASEAARKAFPPNTDDTIRFSVTGGDAVQGRVSVGTQFIRFGMLMNELKRGR